MLGVIILVESDHYLGLRELKEVQGVLGAFKALSRDCNSARLKINYTGR